jgi:hypothetical protein
LPKRQRESEEGWAIVLEDGLKESEQCGPGHHEPTVCNATEKILKDREDNVAVSLSEASQPCAMIACAREGSHKRNCRGPNDREMLDSTEKARRHPIQEIVTE